MSEMHGVENDAPRSHRKCWTGTEYRHVCQTPSGRTCVDCGQPAGTDWGPLWCPDCDVKRLDRVSAGMESLLAPTRPIPPAKTSIDATEETER